MLSGYVACNRNGVAKFVGHCVETTMKHYANGLMMPRKQRNRQIASRWIICC